MQIDFDRTKTLQELEGADWGEIDPELGRSTLERRVYRLSCTPLCEFSVDDLRVFLTQGISPEYVIPLAIDALGKDPWTPGGWPPGLLLTLTLTYGDEFWQERPGLWRALGPVLDRAVALLPTLNEDAYCLIMSLPGEYDELELELVTRAQKDHQRNMVRYLGLEYAYQTLRQG